MTPELFIYGIPIALGFFLIPALIIAIMEGMCAGPSREGQKNIYGQLHDKFTRAWHRPGMRIRILDATDRARPGYEQEWCQQLAKYAGHEGVIVLNCGREGFLVCLHTTDIPVLIPCHFEALEKTRTINRWAPTIITQKENLV